MSATASRPAGAAAQATPAALRARTGRRRLTLGVALTAPAVLGLAAGVVTHLAWPHTWVRMGLALPAVPVLVGVTITLVVLVVSGVRRREAALRRRLAQESRSEHARFLARLDHELKNPLTALSMAVAELPLHQDGTAVLRSQTARLTGLLTDLRKLAQIESAPMEVAPVDLVEVVTDVVEAVREEAAARGQHTSVTTSFPRPPWHLPAVMGDADLLDTAIHNVVANAVKYSPGGGEVEVRGHVEHDTVVLEISDSGVGIPAGDQALVWDELGRAGNARGLPGSGIGLSLVRTVMARHGGRAGLTSQEAVGTRVRLELPVTP